MNGWEPERDVFDPRTLAAARGVLLDTALDRFRADPDVRGVYLAGSLAAGTADEWSDIDLRVVVRSEAHARFVAERRAIPAAWPGHLFNEWLPGTEHCVSHFEPFTKIDVFYLDAARLAPSPWLALPIRVLHDPDGLIADAVARSAGMAHAVDPDEVDRSIGKGIAAAHEAVRRARRGELVYAQTLLDELRGHVVRADDWLHDRPPKPLASTGRRYDGRADPDTYAALAASYVPPEGGAIVRAVRALAAHYWNQVVALHERFAPERSRQGDARALQIVQQLADSPYAAGESDAGDDVR